MNPDLDALAALLERGHEMVTDLCKRQGEPGWRRWEMSIPARPDHDPDLVLGAALTAGDAAVAEVRELRAEIEALRARPCPHVVGNTTLSCSLPHADTARADRLRERVAELEAALDDGISIVMDFAPGHDVWLDSAAKLLTNAIGAADAAKEQG